MSKNMVVRNVKTVSLPDRAFSNVEVSADVLFTPVVKSSWLSRQAAAADFGSLKASLQHLAGFAIMGGFYSLIGFVAVSDNPLLLETGISWFAAGPLLVASIYAPTLAYPLLHKRLSRKVAYANSLNAGVLVTWLSSRYGISISGEVSEILVSLFNSSKKLQGYNFLDVNGKAFTLRTEDYLQYYVMETAGEIEEVLPEYLAGSQALTASQSLEAVDIKGEAKILYDNMISRIEILLKRDLTLENKHVIARVQNDIKQAVQLNNELIVLGQEDAAIFTDVLSALNQEVNDILLSQIDEVRSQFAAQKLYVKSRQRRSANSELVIQVQEVPTVVKRVGTADIGA